MLTQSNHNTDKCSSAINWKDVTPETFWAIADKLQEETLHEANQLFSALEFATPPVLREILI